MAKQDDCDYKIRHRTREDADRAVEEYYEQIVLSVSPVEVYYCTRHDCYHLGHNLTRDQLKDRWKTMNWWKEDEV